MPDNKEEKVVSMKFENEKFEKGVHKTIDTVDKLKASLSFKGSEKGFENIERAASGVRLNGVQTAVQGASAKFAALESTAVNSLTRIANQAISTGQSLIKSLSTDQIMVGWGKYNEKTGSIQTIMNATGKSIDEVNEYLSKLMWFSDETSYGFTDMTSAIGQMTSAGGDIEKLIPMVMGVANATAFAGKGASEFTRIMYNLNQSYSGGFLNLMDWKSVKLAGANSKELVQTLIDVGVELGKIKEGQVDISNFDYSLADRWLDQEVMEKGFGKFSEMTEKAYAMVNDPLSGVETASEAYEILAEQYEGVGITAAKAAQEAKTFEEAIDATKDAVSSKWMEAFEIIFGSYDKAKVTWTRLANELWEIFAAPLDDRNDFLRSVFGDRTTFDGAVAWESVLEENAVAANKFESALITAAQAAGVNLEQMARSGMSFRDMLGEGVFTADIFNKALEDISSAAQGRVIPTLEDLSRVAEEVKRGDWGNGSERFQKLTDAGYDYNIVQGIVESGDYGLAEAEKWLAEQQLNNTTVTDEESEAIKLLGESVGDTDSAFGRLYDQINNPPSGRKSLINGLMNILTSVKNAIFAVRSAWANVFPKDPDKAYGLISSFEKITETFMITEERAQVLQDALEKVFTKIRSGIDYVKSAINLSVLSDFFAPIIEKYLPDVVEKVGNAATAVNEFETQMGSAKDIIVDAKDSAMSFGEMLRNAFSNLKNLFTGFNIQSLEEAFAEIQEGALTAKNSLIGLAKTIFGEDFAQKFSENSGLYGRIILLVAGLAAILAITGTFNRVIDLLTSTKDLFGQIVRTIKSYKVSPMQKAAATLLVFAGSILAIAFAFKIMSEIDMPHLITIAVTLAVLFGGLVAVVLIFNKMKELNKSVQQAVKAILGMAAAIAIVALSLFIMALAFDKLSSIEHPIKSILLALSILVVLGAFLAGMSFLQKKLGLFDPKASLSLLAIAASVLILAQAMLILSLIPTEKIGGVIGAIAVILVGLAVVAFAAKGISWQVGVAFLGITIAVGAIVTFLMLMGGNLVPNLIRGAIRNIDAILYVIIAMGVLIGAARLAGKESLQGALGILALSVAMYIIVGVLGKIASLKIDGGIFGTLIKIALILAMLRVMIAAVNDLNPEGAGQKALAILAIAAAVLILYVAVRLFAKMKIGELLKGAIGIVVVMRMMAVVASAAKGMTASFGAFVGMAIAVAVLAGALAYLSMFKWTDILGAAVGLGVAMIAFAASIRIMGGVAFNAPAIIMLITVVALISVLMYGIWKIGQDTPTDKIIAICVGIASLVVIIGGMTALMGTLAGPCLVGALAFAGVIAILGGIALALGALFDNEKFGASLEKKLDTGIRISEKIGQFIGSFIGGIAEGIADRLPKIGTDLGDFATNAEPFFAAMTSIDASMVSSAKTIVEVFKTLSAADFWSTIADFFIDTPATTPFEVFIGQLGEVLNRFAQDTADINPDSFSKIATSAKSLVEASSIANDITDKTVISISKFSSIVPELANALKDAGDTGSGINESGLDSIISASAKLNDFTATLVKDGGVVQFFTGHQDLENFGEKISSYIENFSIVQTALANISIGAEDLVKIDNIVAASKKLVDLNDSLVLSGGVKQWFSGGKDLEKFGDSLTPLGIGIKIIGDAGNGLDEAAVAMAVSCAEKLIALGNNVTDMDVGVFKSFTRNIPTFGENIAKFASNISGLSEDELAGASVIIDNLKLLAIDIQTTGISLGQTLGVSFEEGLSMTDMVDLSSTFIHSVVKEVFSNGSSEFKETGGDLGDSFLDGFKEITLLALARTRGNALANNVVAGIESIKIFECGEDFIQGFLNGIKSKLPELYDIGVTIGTRVEDGVRGTLEINSPSKVAYEDAVFYGLGIINGLKAVMNPVKTGAANLASGMGEAFLDSWMISQDAFNRAATLSPSIASPVYDLGALQTASGLLNSLNASGSYDIAATMDYGAQQTQDMQLLIGIVTDILHSVQNGSDLYLDDDVLAGRINRRLGQA